VRTEIHPRFASHPSIGDAESILRACVHCGFCNATCPTYLELGDERDGPRGRIYLIKQLLDSGEAGARTQRHLDRCLTCRNCETTCPSGVEYGRLADVARGILESDVERPRADRLVRWLLRIVVPYPRRFAFFLGLGRLLRPMLPRALRLKIPPRHRRPAAAPAAIATPGAAPGAASPASASAIAAPGAAIAGSDAPRRMLVLAGCVQAAATPETNAAAKRVLARFGVQLDEAPAAGCCGALDYHLGDHARGLDHARRNVDAWWPAIEAGANAIVSSASGCGAMLDDYGRLLAGDPAYAAKAARVSALARDLSEVLAAEDMTALGGEPSTARIAVHCPCTLQHAQKLPNLPAAVLRQLGFTLTETAEPHLCCGSAGSYSILQPRLAARLRDRKLAALGAGHPDMIVTANIGCQLHLAAGTELPVRHWIEAVDASLRS
jgi:glycolate dehydrogenase iron-sulfur subunit